MARHGAESAGDAVAMQRAASARASKLAQPEGFSLMGTLNSLLEKASTLVMIAMPVAWGARKIAGMKSLNKHLPRVSGGLGKVADVANLQDVPVSDFKAAVSGVMGKNKAGEEHLVTRGVDKAAGHIEGFAQKTLYKTKLGTKIAEGVKGASVANVVWGAAATASTLYEGVSSMKGRARVIQQMEKDLTGRDISATKALYGKDLNPLVMQARKEATGASQWAATGMRVAGLATNLAMMFGKQSGKKTALLMGGSIAASVAANALTSQNTALAAYQGMYQSFAQTGKASVDSYEGLIGGLAKKADGDTVRMVAERAYVKQMAPADVLKMMAETDFLKNPAFVAQMRAEKRATKLASPQQAAPGPHARMELNRRKAAAQGAQVSV